MITIDELKVQLADYGKAVKDLEEALAIDASRKRVQELEHTITFQSSGQLNVTIIKRMPSFSAADTRHLPAFLV